MRIAAIAPLAEDRLHDLRTGERSVRPGGPGLWIARALANLQVECAPVHGQDPAIVEIDVDDSGERGKIVSSPAIVVQAPVVADVAVVSTVSNEFSLGQLSLLPSTVALDVQGYVRAARMVGQHPVTLPNTPQLAIVKATEEELGYLDPAWVEQQKSRALLVTRGADGCDVYDGGKFFHQPATPVAVPSTVGAGDVFLASFLVEWLRSRSSAAAAAFAARQSSEFLIREYGS